MAEKQGYPIWGNGKFFGKDGSRDHFSAEICISDIKEEDFYTKKDKKNPATGEYELSTGKKYITINGILKPQEKQNKFSTHGLVVNTWKPDSTKKKPEPKPESEAYIPTGSMPESELPF